jgi:hypothetical protein
LRKVFALSILAVVSVLLWTAAIVAPIRDAIAYTPPRLDVSTASERERPWGESPDIRVQIQMDDRYEKASRYDLQAQLRNFRTFLAEIREAPWKAFVICALFAACSLALFVVRLPPSAKFPSPWPVWIVALLAAAISLYFAWQGMLGLLAKR